MANNIKDNLIDKSLDELPGIIDISNDFFSSILQKIWPSLESMPLLKFVLIILFGYIVAKLIQFIVIGITSIVTRKTKTQLDDQLLALLKRPIFLVILILFLIISIRGLQMDPSFRIVTERILLSFLVLYLMMRGFTVLHILLNALGALRDKYQMIQAKTVPLFELAGKISLFAITSYVVLLIWGINPTAWLASAGVIGIAVGFAAKDTLSNLFSGFFIIVDAPYKTGDYIVLDSGERGMVTHVGIRSTRILTRDDLEVTLPNAVIGNAKIQNESTGRWEKQRIRLPVGVAYGSDLDLVCEELIKIAVEHTSVCDNPDPRMRLRAFGASSIDFELMCWIDDPEVRGRVKHEMYMSIYKKLNELKIEIPYAKQDLYIKEMPKEFYPKKD
jgi:small-conductance mechanosensitive channel